MTDAGSVTLLVLLLAGQVDGRHFVGHNVTPTIYRIFTDPRDCPRSRGAAMQHAKQLKHTVLKTACVTLTYPQEPSNMRPTSR